MPAVTADPSPADQMQTVEGALGTEDAALSALQAFASAPCHSILVNNVQTLQKAHRLVAGFNLRMQQAQVCSGCLAACCEANKQVPSTGSLSRVHLDSHLHAGAQGKELHEDRHPCCCLQDPPLKQKHTHVTVCCCSTGSAVGPAARAN